MNPTAPKPLNRCKFVPCLKAESPDDEGDKEQKKVPRNHIMRATETKIALCAESNLAL